MTFRNIKKFIANTGKPLNVDYHSSLPSLPAPFLLRWGQDPTLVGHEVQGAPGPIAGHHLVVHLLPRAPVVVSLGRGSIGLLLTRALHVVSLSS